MLILDPKKIRDEKKITEQETQRRILGLQQEEAEANRRTNLARENEQREKARIAAEANKGVPELMAKKTNLQNEVEVLEKRKIEATKPITETLEQAQAQLAENIKQGELIKVKLAQLDTDKELLLDRLDSQNEAETEIKSQLADIERRKRGLEAAEALNKQTAEDLRQKLLEFYATVAAKDAEFASREAAIGMQTQANTDRHEILNQLAAELSKKQLALEDGYKNLAAARKEILGRED